MKIGIDARFVGPQGTGLGKYTEKLILNLAKIDSKNQYVIFLKKDNWNYFHLPKNFKKVLADVAWYSLQEQLKMPKVFLQQNLDLLHVPHFNVPIFYNPPKLSLFGLHEQSEFSGKFVVTIHDLIHHQFSESSTTTRNLSVFKVKRLAYKFIIANAIKRSAKIIVPSNHVKSQILEHFKIDPAKIVVTYEAAEEEYSQKSIVNGSPREAGQLSIVLEKFHIKKPFLIYVGNAYPHKNLNALLDAFKILVNSSQFTPLRQGFAGRAVHRKSKSVNSFESEPEGSSLRVEDREPTTDNLRLIIVCSRDVFIKRLNEEIKNRGLKDKVTMTGYVDAKDLRSIFRQAEAYIFPSLAEGFGIPGLNAMASGLPVISSNIPTLKEVYGDAALYFDPKNPNDIVQKISQVLSNSKTKSALIKKGKEQAKKYSWQKMAKETLGVYQKVA